MTKFHEEVFEAVKKAHERKDSCIEVVQVLLETAVILAKVNYVPIDKESFKDFLIEYIKQATDGYK
jgi:hypothetical protein